MANYMMELFELAPKEGRKSNEQLLTKFVFKPREEVETLFKHQQREARFQGDGAG